MISARNHFHGIVKEVHKGAVNGIVKLETPGGNRVSSTISMEAIEDLKLAEGKKACIFVKATEVMLANDNLKISARNQWKGTVGAKAVAIVKSTSVILGEE